MELSVYGDFLSADQVLANLSVFAACIALVAGAVVVLWAFAEAAYISGARSRLITSFVRLLTRPFRLRLRR